MENKIRKIIREQIQKLHEYLVDYYVVYDKSTGEEVTRFQKPPYPSRALSDAKRFIQRMQDSHEKSEKERYERHALMFKDNPEDMDFRPNPKPEYEIGTDTESRSMEEGMSPEEWADAKEKERLDQHPEKDKINKIKQMMDKEKALKIKATELGYLKEIDLNAVSYEKVTFVYTEQGGQFYGLDVYENKDQPQRSAKLRYDEANEWLKDTLGDLHGDIDIPRRYGSGMEELDDIVKELEELGIEASHGDYMDIS